jgi:protein ImuB
MRRVGCLWVPDLSLVAHLRLDPDAAGIPLALTADRSTRSPVVAITVSAATAGVRMGMTPAQARVVCDALVIRPASPEALAAAIATLADVADTMSERVETHEDGRVFFDCEGSRHVCRSESELATVLGARAARQGLPAWVGIADSKLGASIAAREGSGIMVVPPGGTRVFLAPLPLSRLNPTPTLASVLSSWGIRLIGELATLSVGAVAHRLGPAGARLVRLAKGEDDEPLLGRTLPTVFREGISLDYGIDSIEPLMFVTRRLIEGVTSRFALHGIGCDALEIRLGLANGGCDIRRVSAAAPTAECRTLLMLVRAHLEQRPPTSSVIDLAIAVAPVRVRPMQLDWLRARGPAPTALAETLARLAVLCGPGRVGRVMPRDSHRPDAIEVAAFAMEATDPRATAGMDRPPFGSTEGGTVVRMALRALRPPVLLEVFDTRGNLDYVRGRGFGGRVVHVGGPWRLRGEWWTDDPYAREYYDVELSDGGVYRIYRDLRTQQWLADGAYD